MWKISLLTTCTFYENVVPNVCLVSLRWHASPALYLCMVHLDGAPTMCMQDSCGLLYIVKWQLRLGEGKMAT